MEVDDPELAYRRSCGINIKRYNGTMPVRELSRAGRCGLTLSRPH